MSELETLKSKLEAAEKRRDDAQDEVNELKHLKQLADHHPSRARLNQKEAMLLACQKEVAALEERVSTRELEERRRSGAEAGTSGDIASLRLQLDDIQATLGRLSPRLEATVAKHIKSSMFIVFGGDEGVERGKAQLTEANLLAHEANEASTSSPPPGGAPYTPSMFVGMGFFYFQPGLAAAPAHLLTQEQLQGKTRVRILMPVSGKELELQVVQNCDPVDLAYMRLVDSTPEAGAGLEFISPEDKFADEVGVQTRVELFSTNLGPWGRVGGPRRNIDIIWTHGKINMMMREEFHYTVSTWGGDCGGPIVMSIGGKLLGMHVAMDNTSDITSSKKRKSSDRISALESSIASSGPHIAVALAVTEFPAPPTNV